MKIRLRLKEILIERNLSQRQLSLMAKLRPATINALCNGTTDRIYLSTLEEICKALDIHIHELIDQDDS